jgi:hypothetical protein
VSARGPGDGACGAGRFCVPRGRLAVVTGPASGSIDESEARARTERASVRKQAQGRSKRGALLIGCCLGDGGSKDGPGRKLSNVATVQGNGDLRVGKAYTAQLGLQPGDEFEIKLGRKQVRLVPVGGEEGTEGSRPAQGIDAGHSLSAQSPLKNVSTRLLITPTRKPKKPLI